MGAELFEFFFNDTATTEIFTLSLHDALPICPALRRWAAGRGGGGRYKRRGLGGTAPERDRGWAWSDRGQHTSARRQHRRDRKSTRLNSSHANISYAVFCL